MSRKNHVHDILKIIQKGSQHKCEKIVWRTPEIFHIYIYIYIYFRKGSMSGNQMEPSFTSFFKFFFNYYLFFLSV